MFEDISEAELIDDMGDASRAESAAIARRLALVGELVARRAQQLAECKFWFTDPVQAAAAEISAAQNVSRGRAVGQAYNALVLRDRLPQVAAVFATGAIDYRMVLAIITRTDNVEDDDLIERLDAALARHVHKWMKLSKRKLRDRLDLWVAKFDPAAVRVPPKVDDQRGVEITELGPGMAGIWASLHSEDGAALNKRLDALADSVCENDPRTKKQRRADAFGPLARLEAHLICQCGSADCPAAAERNAVKDVVIHVLAEQNTIDGTGDHPGYLPGFGILPAESVRRLAKSAKLKPVELPNSEAERGYRPSVALAEFVKLRDLTCRFPGCDAPAEVCDIDHSVPFPSGPTHPSNTKIYCRTHHLVKTFITGPNGWSERQLADGTVILTAPTGHTYRTEPHGGALFSALRQSTGDLRLPTVDQADTRRSLMMPLRRRTREQDRRERIARERREREELIAEEERQRQAWLAAIYEPPPF